MIDHDPMWAESLKPGDDIAVTQKYGAGEIGDKVARVTKAQVFTVGGRSFWKKNGRTVGADTWTSQYMRPMTDDVLKDIRFRSDLALLGKVSSKQIKVSPEIVRAMVAIYEGSKSQ